MKKFYEKSELWFSITWIIIYVAIMGNLRNNFGDESIFSLLGVLIIAAILTIFIVKNNLKEKYGLVLCKNAKRFLYFIPFVLLCSVNLWFGAEMHYDLPHQIIAMITMLLIGYTEEVIFRGLLFKAIEKDSIKQAIVISAVTFGIGHIVNLLTGQDTIATILQVAYAIAIGFSFVMCFYKCGSLIPCIVTHSIINMTSKISIHNEDQIWSYIIAIFIIVVAGSYTLYLKKQKN